MARYLADLEKAGVLADDEQPATIEAHPRRRSSPPRTIS